MIDGYIKCFFHPIQYKFISAVVVTIFVALQKIAKRVPIKITLTRATPQMHRVL